MKSPGLIICLLLLSACASTPQSKQLRADGAGALPLAVELTDTPFFPQTQYQCGPAALATVMEFHGVNTTPEELASQVYLPERKGSLQIEMAVAARRHDMLPYRLEPTLGSLFSELAAGNPVLVLQNLGFAWYPQWHYAVVVGYDINNNEIILRSGETERWLTPIEVFERTWQRADHWALVILPVAEVPHTAEPLPYLQTVYAFEETGNTAAALRAYRAATQQWPGSTISWLTLGNLAMQKQDWEQAIQAFQAAATLQPESTVSWNNLAYALHYYGCAAEAKAALQCALAIAPDDINLLDSWRELLDLTANNPQAECPEIHCNKPTSNFH